MGRIDGGGRRGREEGLSGIEWETRGIDEEAAEEDEEEDQDDTDEEEDY